MSNVKHFLQSAQAHHLDHNQGQILLKRLRYQAFGRKIESTQNTVKKPQKLKDNPKNTKDNPKKNNKEKLKAIKNPQTRIKKGWQILAKRPKVASFFSTRHCCKRT